MNRTPHHPAKLLGCGVSLTARPFHTDDNASRHALGFADGSAPHEVREYGPATSTGSADESEHDFPRRPRAVQRREPGSNHASRD